MTESGSRFLDEQGFLVLEQFLPYERVEELRACTEELFAAEGDRSGAEFKQEPNARRLANLVDKGEAFERLVADPGILEYVGAVLGPEFKLSSLNARSANPRSDCGQPLHADMAAIADELGYWVCNIVWMLDDFTAENGAIRAVPGSHRWGKLPQTELADLWAAHPQEILLTAPAGTAVVMNAHMWHGGTANRTDAPRRALHSFYCRWDKPPPQYQKRLLPPELQQRLSPLMRRLLALDDEWNDRVSAAPAVVSGFLK